MIQTNTRPISADKQSAAAHGQKGLEPLPSQLPSALVDTGGEINLPVGPRVDFDVRRPTGRELEASEYHEGEVGLGPGAQVAARSVLDWS